MCYSIFSLKAQTQRFLDQHHPDSAKIVARRQELDDTCQRLHSLSATRMSRLQVGQNIYSVCNTVEPPIRTL